VFPGKLAPQKANENVGDGFQVVPPALLLAEEVVDRSIPCGASSGGGTALGVVFQCVRVTVPSGHAEINEVNRVGVMPPDYKVTLGNE